MNQMNQLLCVHQRSTANAGIELALQNHHASDHRIEMVVDSEPVSLEVLPVSASMLT